MLMIREAQMSAFARAERERLAAQLYPMIARHWTAELGTRGEVALRQSVRTGIDLALAHGIDTERDILRFLNVRMALGDDYHLDARYPWARDLLVSSAQASLRVNALCAAAARALGVSR